MRTRDESKWKARKPRANKPRRTPIPLLALHLRIFNAPAINKADYARIRATLADRLIAQSEPIRERL